MELQQAFKCKTCGRPLDEFVAQSTNGLVECPSCYNVWTIPKKETGPAALQFLRMGEHDLDNCKFDEALTAYEKAAEHDTKEPEAYFGMALAAFKVQYLKDHVNNRVQPICHEITEKKFTDSKEFLQALRYATAEQRAEYERKGAEIDYILGEFFKLKEAGVDYDCFICVKVTDDYTKQPTEDSKDADYIYRLLQDKGYKPFYSERELRNLTGADYEARIMYALYTSECMLVVCQKEEYLQTPWVKNEYTRFLKLVNDEEKESDSITIVFHGKPVERLPGRAGKIQGINFALREADGKIVEFVDSHTPETKKRRAAEKKKRAEKEDAILQQIEEQKRQQRELEDRLKNLQGGQGMQATASSLLTRGYQELASKNIKEANTFFDRVLEAEPKNGEAWWGKLLIELDVWNDDLLDERLEIGTFRRMMESRNYNNAVQYAYGSFKTHLEEVCGRLKDIAEKRCAPMEAEREKLSEKLEQQKASFKRREGELLKKLDSASNKAKAAREKIPHAKPAAKGEKAVFGLCGGIAIIAALALFIYFVVISYTKTEEEFAEFPAFLTWGYYEQDSIVAFVIAIAKSVVYGAIIAVAVMLIPTICVLASGKKTKKKIIEYELAEKNYNDLQQEVNKIDRQLNDLRNDFYGKERGNKDRISVLTKQIDTYSYFL